MDIFDWYFKQIVTQSQMDWAFDRVQDSIHGASLDNEFVGIVTGMGAQQHAGVPDKTIDIGGPAVAYDPEGQRCYVPDLLTVVDCSQDEFGTDSNPPTPGFERYISVFIRFDRNLTEPALDGNNVVIYTKQLESFEFFVRLGAEAPAGTAIPAPLMTDAVLVCDILVANGFTAILNADFDLTRRQDWVRYVGATIGTHVYGTAKDAVDGMLALIDSWGGALPFTFTSTWFGAAPVLGPVPPPTTIQESLDAIVFDLAGTGAGPSGSDYVGTTDSGAFPGGFVTPWVSADLQTVLMSLGTDLDGHIGGLPPQHPAASITFAPYAYLTSIDVQAVIQELVDDLTDWTATGGASRVGNDAYSWLSSITVRTQIREIVDDLAAVGAGVSGASRSGTEPIAGSPESIAASDVMAVLTAVYGHLNDRTERSTDEIVDGAWEFFNGLAPLQRQRSSQNLKFRDSPFFNTVLGGTNSPFMMEKAVASKFHNNFANWTHPFSDTNGVGLGGALALVDICVIFNPTNNRRRIALLDAGGNLITFDPFDFTLFSTYVLTGSYGAGTWLPEAMCSDGQYVYVMAYDSGTTTHKVQAFDAWTGAVKAGWPATGTLLPGAGSAFTPLGNSMASRIIVAEDPFAADPLLVTVNPWTKCIAAATACMTSLRSGNGAILTNGSGDCTFGGPPDFWPSGGLCSDGTNVFASFKDSSTGAVCVASATIANLAVGSGFAAMPTTLSLSDDCLEIINDGEVLWVILKSGDIYNYELADQAYHQKIWTAGTSLLKFGAMDGLNVWLNDRETTDDSQIVWQIPTQRTIAKTGGVGFAVAVKDWANLLSYNEIQVATPPTYDGMGKVCYDGDSIWCILDWRDTFPLSGVVRRIPRSGIR